MTNLKLQKLAIFAGDVISFYLALNAVLIARYQTFEVGNLFNLHFFPFTILLIFWLLIFIIAGLYDNEVLNAGSLFLERFVKAIIAGLIVGIALFYTIPSLGVTPKTNLLFFTILNAGFVFGWRKAFGFILKNTAGIKVLFFGYSQELREIIDLLNSNRQFGYNPAALVYSKEKGKPKTDLPSFELNHNLPEIIKQNGISLVAALDDIHYQKDFIKFLYQVLPMGVSFLDFPTFYERLTGKIPVSLINETWFLENLTGGRNGAYELFKRFFDIAGAICIFLFFTAIFPFIALGIKFSSPGPIFIRQNRVGKNDKIFSFIKFRSMTTFSSDGLAETNGPKWAEKNDARIFWFGKLIRKTRLDELPQIFNILAGDMSFIGPRPERPEFTKELEKQIPHYHMRHLVKPGLSGWAQMNFPYGASVEDAFEKLQYDLYYIKRRSIFLDFIIALRTIAIIFSREGR